MEALVVEVKGVGDEVPPVEVLDHVQGPQGLSVVVGEDDAHWQVRVVRLDCGLGFIEEGGISLDLIPMGDEVIVDLVAHREVMQASLIAVGESYQELDQAFGELGVVKGSTHQVRGNPADHGGVDEVDND